MFENIKFDFRGWITWVFGKALGQLGSRKFWAFVAAVVAASQGLALGEITHWQFVEAVVAAAGIFTAATAYEDANRK